MKTYLDCYPCFLRQALGAARRAGVPEPAQHQILLETMQAMSRLPTGATPPEMAESIHALVRNRAGDPDPYLADKRDATRQVLALLPSLRQRVRDARDPLDTAVRIAIAGNIIDHGISDDFALESTLERVLSQPFAIDGLEPLRHRLTQAASVLYLADNAGETVFDRVLIEHLALPVTYVVKAGPIINDATHEDAVDAGLQDVATIVNHGLQAPGTLLSRCSEDFQRRFEAADLIIAKGQGNYESLSDHPGPIFFLLQAKCIVIAQDLGVATGSIVLKAPNHGLSAKNSP